MKFRKSQPQYSYKVYEMDDKSESHYFYKLLKLNGTVLIKYIFIEKKKEIKEKYILTKTAEVWDNWKRYVPFLFLSY